MIWQQALRLKQFQQFMNNEGQDETIERDVWQTLVRLACVRFSLPEKCKNDGLRSMGGDRSMRI